MSALSSSGQNSTFKTSGVKIICHYYSKREDLAAPRQKARTLKLACINKTQDTIFSSNEKMVSFNSR
ncbi:hypothetical protein EUGRSUZ_G02728 [Eucalyptus grandis]|uniref:Uncharacterized protein n=2 Tax=Eucalyptus grandis TaxID=71139 RepID=A0ACC3K9L5_EUCGR|nr:hypothetical protein EUGRSUZ_G02728 [Eucalyptus grandis]